jgi:capsular polysaccharide transport system permease protein
MYDRIEMATNPRESDVATDLAGFMSSRGAMARLIRGQPPEPEEAAAGAPPVPVGIRTSRISPRPPDAEMPRDEGAKSVRRRKHRAFRYTRGRGFALTVLLPLCMLALYMTAFARPQFTSTVAFTVRSAEHGGMSDALTGFAQFAGASRNTDALILAEFLQSQTLLERLDRRLDLVRHYAAPFDRDPLFALAPSASIEARLTHWRRMLHVQSDPSSGLLELRIHAFSPEMAQLIARELLVESRTLLNELNADARTGTTARAEAELATARDRLTEARAALTAFRTESRILDPNSDFEGRAGVLRHLQGQLAQALVEQDIAGVGVTEAPRIGALRDRIEAERTRLVRAPGAEGLDYPVLLAMHERLTADRDFAEAAYRTARTALDLTLAQAARLDLYLAVYVQPTLPERADHARPLGVIGLAALFLCLVWAIATLMRSAILDRR